MDPLTITTSTVLLRDAAGNVVTATLTYNTATNTVTLLPSSPLAPGTTYMVTIVGGEDGVKDAAGNPLASDVTWAFTTAPAPTCPCSIWSVQATPAVTSWSDASAVELGLKFCADVDGFITGLRFYKGSANTGPHLGNLWTNTGTLLASVMFEAETASGWQQVDLPMPVAITANTTYIASYHTTVGYYAVTGAYFTSIGVDKPPLHALPNGVDGGNGVYKYGASGFPTQTFNATNYWVDIVLTTTAPPPPPPPPVASFTGTPTSGNVPLTVAFNDTSTGEITTWNWNFGDGGTSTAQHRQHTYASTGSYTVMLTVSGPHGVNTATRQGYITVQEAPPPSMGLMAAYSFDEGNGHLGTISGATWVTSGRFGKALLFDGVNDRVSMADAPSLDLTTGMTLEAWVYPTALSGGSANGWRTVILKEQPGQLVYALYANSDNNRPSGYAYTSSHFSVYGNVQLPFNAWRHLATTYDGATLRLYVNGALVGSRALAGSIRTSGQALRFAVIAYGASILRGASTRCGFTVGHSWPVRSRTT